MRRSYLRRWHSGLFLFLLVTALFATPAITGPPAPAGVGRDGHRLMNQPAADFGARRIRLLEQVRDGVVVLTGGHEEDFGNVGRFRQNANFAYMTGVETPGAYLILAPEDVMGEGKSLEIIFIPPRNPAQERWSGVQMGPGEEAQRLLGASEVAGSDRFIERLREVVSGSEERRVSKIYTVVPRGGARLFTREHLFVERLKREFPGVDMVDVSPLIGEMRKVKSRDEIDLLQRAIDITIEAHFDVARMMRPGKHEYEVQAVLEYAFLRNGAERPGFPSIVGAGFNSTILHYNTNRARIEAGDLVVVDIGAEYSYYTADITRTYPASGKFTPRQREVYELVLEAQRACERVFKPGRTTMGQLKQAAMETMRQSKLRDSQGMTLDNYFIHGLGHWLGMDVHDVGDYSKPIPPGAVITIEPGIYIPEERLGVRIEDDYLVTETGLIKMSGKLPSAPDEIEKLISGSR